MVDFLVQHEHCTVFEGNVSSTVRVNSSVIQGSVIGPGSYDVAASDLHPVVDGNKLVKFADDLTLIIPARNLETRQTELNNIQSWSTENNLQLNCKKSQEMIISRPRTRQIQDIPELPDIRRVMSVKLLGVTLTGQFSMEQHISEVISSSARALYALRILRTHGMKDADLQTVFRATALSKLLYASPPGGDSPMPIKGTALKVSFGKLPGHDSTLRDLPLSRSCVWQLMWRCSTAL